MALGAPYYDDDRANIAPVPVPRSLTGTAQRPVFIANLPDDADSLAGLTPQIKELILDSVPVADLILARQERYRDWP